MHKVQLFMLRQGKTVFSDVSTDVHGRLTNAKEHFRRFDPSYSLQLLLTNICRNEDVPKDTGPSEEEIVRWLKKNGF